MFDTKDIISRLKLISSVKKGEKINTKNSSVQSRNVFDILYRTVIIPDNRHNMINYVEETLEKAFILLLKYETIISDQNHEKSDNIDEYKIMRKNLVGDIYNAIGNLSKLKETYMNDIKIVCDLDAIIQLNNAKIQRYLQYIDSLELDQIIA